MGQVCLRAFLCKNLPKTISIYIYIYILYWWHYQAVPLPQTPTPPTLHYIIHVPHTEQCPHTLTVTWLYTCTYIITAGVNGLDTPIQWYIKMTMFISYQHCHKATDWSVDWGVQFRISLFNDRGSPKRHNDMTIYGGLSHGVTGSLVVGLGLLLLHT